MQRLIDMLSFPLYHGTSDHYLAHFRLGYAPTAWPYQEGALKLLREAWEALRAAGVEPDWWVAKILEQVNDRSNWQHGELYVTPSKQSAVRYARSGASDGGELLTQCRFALDRLAEVGSSQIQRINELAIPLFPMAGDAGKPILILLSNIRLEDIIPERAKDDADSMIAELTHMKDELREVIGQQRNFRLRAGAGVVAKVFALEIHDDKDFLSRFKTKEIRSFPL